MRIQFMVSENDKKKRELFYDYITNNYCFDISYPYIKEKFIESNFPFIVDFGRKNFWVCESITCCACAASSKLIFTIPEYLEQEKKLLAIK